MESVHFDQCSLEAINGGHPAGVHKVEQGANDGDVGELRKGNLFQNSVECDQM